MTTERNRFTGQELLSSRLAAGALVVLSLALATAARAEPVTKFDVATVTPTKSSSASHRGTQTAAA